MQSPDPFSVLGLAPTLDLAAVKRAYVEAVRRHPPHADPEAFRRVRAAYEMLSNSRGLQLAWLSAPLDAEAELTRWHERFDAEIKSVCERRQQQSSAAGCLERFIEHCARMRIA